MTTSYYNFVFLLFSMTCFDRILSFLFDIKGIYFLFHFFHNIIISTLTFQNVIQVFSLQNEGILDKQVIEWIYALHCYHLILYYRYITFSEKIHHVVSLGVAIPLVLYFFENRNLLGFSFFATTGVASLLHYFSLFLYKNGLVDKSYTVYINYLSNTYIRNPLILMNCSFILQFIQTEDYLSQRDIFFSLILFFILFWNGVYFQSEVARAYFRLSGNQ